MIDSRYGAGCARARCGATETELFGRKCPVEEEPRRNDRGDCEDSGDFPHFQALFYDELLLIANDRFIIGLVGGVDVDPAGDNCKNQYAHCGNNPD